MTTDTILYICIVIYSIILHEIAHGYVAKLCGDRTAEDAGRLTLNPGPHLDPIGSVILPVTAVLSGFGVFGWAKGVPVNLYNLNGSKIKEFLISVAGIVTNLILATIFLLLIKFNVIPEIYSNLLIKAATVNIGLAFFNLLPIPPFDGMSILRAFFPSLKHKYQHLEHNPVALIVIILVASFLFSFIYKDILDFVFGIFF